jgi:predicted enzyme related to lactoylglutathione lyase
MADVFEALATPARRAILDELHERDGLGAVAGRSTANFVRRRMNQSNIGRGLFLSCLAAALMGCNGSNPDRPKSSAEKPDISAKPAVIKGQTTMQIYYLEIVTKEVNAVCATYAAATGVQFSEPDAGLGNARTAPMPGGGLMGVRAPLRETEEPVVRPYWLVDDVEAAVRAAAKAGAVIAHPPMKIPGHGTFAICLQGGIDHGFWQK